MDNIQSVKVLSITNDIIIDSDKDIEPDDEDLYPDWDDFKENYMPHIEVYVDSLASQED